MRTSISTLIVSLLSANAMAAQHMAPAAATPPTPAPAATPAPVAAGTVARAQFTSGVQDREPVDKLTALGSDKTQVYFYTELKDLAGAKVTHRWEYKGQVVAEIPIEVGSARWRVWSSKTLDPQLSGEWKVSVVDSGGAAMTVQTLNYGAPAQPAAAPAAEPVKPSPSTVPPSPKQY